MHHVHLLVCLWVSLLLYVRLFVCLCTFLSICTSLYLSVGLFICMHVCLSELMSAHLSVVYLLQCLYRTYLCLPEHLSVCVLVYHYLFSVRLSICQGATLIRVKVFIIGHLYWLGGLVNKCSCCTKWPVDKTVNRLTRPALNIPEYDKTEWL